MKTDTSKRFITDFISSNDFGRQMRFITGPRQCGKTTVAKQILSSTKSDGFYYNWDRSEIRDRYRREKSFLDADYLDRKKGAGNWVCFDEIHKVPKWKNILKDFFDANEERLKFIVTGSARLDLFRRSGDSLAGRYFLFRLNPFILAELLNKDIKSVLPEQNAIEYIEKNISSNKYEQGPLEQILKFSAFPEPLLKANTLFSKKWQEGYFETIIKEDIRDISHIQQIEKVIDLLFLLPSRIASPLSINSLKNELELNYNTIKNYINYLIMGYVIFSISPYSKKGGRLVKKEKKIYFFNWNTVEDEAARFENFVALELKSRVDLWNDVLEDRFELMYVRDRTGAETDFLILKNLRPFMLCEAKLSSQNISRHHYAHSKLVGDVPFVQIIKKNNVLRVENKMFFVVSASRFFS